ncbi:BadF/BadG/BcrA/BcrD ATPase family protein [Spirosoma luteum]|uniref:BadF/BadG/BcrA/BcrD ATPase family protein n=1 Tax=Spirosoma luteum TaxID=431553 RepID=UPI000374ED9E|nr:BadF/BadG/BcrA/BcrD ATPase family protein [Spirosoma luteum]
MTTQLIADSGSTKTDWRLLDADGTIHARQTDGLNPYYQSSAQMVDILKDQLHLPVTDARIEQLFFYGAGCSGSPVNGIVGNALKTLFPDAKHIDVNSDMLGAARGASGHQAGIVCILGTGSNACCYENGQITRGIQSLGFWLGDEGSGGYLGKTLVRDFFQDRLPADLHQAFQIRYALDRPALLENAYRKPFPNRYFASFTPFLSDHLAHPYVTELVTGAFISFLTTYVSRFPESVEWPVHFVGSIAHYFSRQLRTAVEQTGLTMGNLLKAPAEGLVGYHRNG